MKILGYLLLVVIFVSSCRKQVPRDLSGPEPTVSCYNGIQDGDETGIDCGGSCGGSCAVTPSCVIGNDTLLFSLSNGSDYYRGLTTASSTQGTDFQAVANFTSSYSITVTIQGTPDETIEYIDGDPSSLSAGQADVEFYNAGSYAGSGGKVYVEDMGSSYKITACNYTWSNGGFGSITGRLNFTVLK